MSHTTERLGVVDALRGFAVVAIMLLHNLEHFDLYHSPSGQPAWLDSLDKGIWETMFFLFGSKAYLIFAFLFGVTFALQFDRRAALGLDFRPRFAWRMLLLFGFGLINSLVYQGDILTFYAVLGFCLLPVARLRNGVVLAIACLLLLQPYALFELVRALPAPPAKLPNPESWAYYGRTAEYLGNGSLWEVWAGNLTTGRMAATLWSWENARMFQIPALFMLGMLACRTRLFADEPAALGRLRRIAVTALLVFLPLFFTVRYLNGWDAAEGIKRPLITILTSLSNFAQATLMVAMFALLFRSAVGKRVLSRLAPIGRMSLTSYMMQSLVGTTIYYGYGLGLYKVTGATVCLLIGATLALLQWCFSSWWLRNHSQGPLETLWHRATWIGRPAVAPAQPAGQA
jgi:uncharacterized protein